MTQNTLRLFLPLLVLGLAACNDEVVTPAAVPPPPQPAAAPTLDVSIVQGASVRTDDAFNPNPVEIEPGTTVTWTNNDSTDHTVTSDEEGLWDSGNLAPGQTFSRQFSEEGDFDYHCSIHPQMQGTVTVKASPSPSPSASPEPSETPSPDPSDTPSPEPSASPSPEPSVSPSASPTP